MEKVLVTGGDGFIGSNFVKYLLQDSGFDNTIVINIDKQTYAGRGKNLQHMGLSDNKRYTFIRGDIGNYELIEHIFNNFQPTYVINIAAESHVDRSIANSLDFILSNIVGPVTLLDAARRHPVKKFVQVSTDEVYGSTETGYFTETDALNPSSPYSASKASAEHMALSYFKTHQVPVIITRGVNNYGPYQYPEKLLPLFITNLIDAEQVPLMWSDDNPGLNVRDWLHVEDHCRAIWFLANKGKPGQVYNIPGNNERTNIEMTKTLLDIFRYGERMIKKVPHRNAHDYRYAIDGKKLEKIGFQYSHSDLKIGLEELVAWYVNNQDWWRPLKK
jgi:dTDP-glucose 4,6-dehydratase